MRRVRVPGMCWAVASMFAIAATPAPARADIVLHDKDGWSFYTTGLVAAHYQLMFGDSDPSTTHGVLVGNKIEPAGAEDPRDNSLFLSRVRSGFIGTQIGFGVGRQISETVHIESLVAVSLNDISSNRGQNLPKDVDFREAWAALITPYGSFKFGRMFSIFGSASAPVVLLAYRYGVGNPCFASVNTIACASVGAGPLFAGFDAQLRYVSPRALGLEFQLAVSDPVVGPGYHMSPLPRFDAELNYLQSFSPSGRVRVFAQGIVEKLQRVEGANLKSATVQGVMGSAVVDLGGFSVGGGGWTGKGIGVRTVVEATDAANPLAYDSTGELRLFRGFFGNAAYDYHGTALGVGGGTVSVRATAADTAGNAGVDVISKSTEWHVVFTQKIDALVLSAEYMNWKNQWYYGEKQTVSFAGVGANFVW